MKNTVIKRIIVTIFAFAFITTINNNVFAAPAATMQSDGGGSSSTSSSFDTDYWTPTNETGNSTIVNMGNVILTVIKAIGSVVSVVILIVLGIKYMIGSVEEKADMKKAMIPYVVGAILLFATTNLASIIYDIVNQF